MKSDLKYFIIYTCDFALKFSLFFLTVLGSCLAFSFKRNTLSKTPARRLKLISSFNFSIPLNLWVNLRVNFVFDIGA